MNWNYTERIQGPMANYMNLLFVLFMILLNFSFSMFSQKPNTGNIDTYGHLGGLIAGFFLIFLIATPSDVNDNCCCSIKIWWGISITYLALNYVLGLCLIYFVYN